MRIRKLAVVFTLLMFAFLYSLVHLYKQTSVQKRDIIYYNDLLYKIEADLSSGRDVDLIENEYGCKIIFSKEINDPELVEMYANEAFVLDLVVDGEYIGKVAWLDKLEEFNFYGGEFLSTSLIIWFVLLLIGYALFYVIYLVYVRPVDDLKNFSKELAKGNLDAKLPIRRNNMFGGFTEAFDIMREELKASQTRQMEAEIARKELVASLSHDVKTPVAVIDATCEVLGVKLNRKLKNLTESDEPDSSEIDEVKDSLDKVEIISAKAATIQTLMTDLMHSNMENSEKVDVNPMEDFASHIEDYLSSISGYGQITLKNHISNCLIYMDRKRMEQVLDNIIGNSVKYAGTPISVSFDEINDMMMAGGRKGSFIRIRIKDSGPGVSEEDLPLIAQKYYRGTNTGSQPGYGMGLYLVKLYMQKQGGDMEYFNDNGFVVGLMLRKV
ncbi:MAG: HAMP domain-containing histidine kinase [Lachnospiraceae bacterium]|nr:HAMP domain-containing histidine kinase [Lachnospiraceae bacterium]